MIQGIGYVLDGKATMEWDGGTDGMDEAGNPTGEKIHSVRRFIDALPEGTPYTELSGDEAEASAWREAHQPPPTLEELTADFTAKIQARLDGFARTRGYDDILSAATYATSAVERFRAEGRYCAEARDATWARGYELLAQARASGNIPAWETVEAALPELAWP